MKLAVTALSFVLATTAFGQTNTSTTTAPAPAASDAAIGFTGGLKSTSNLARESEVRLTTKRLKSKNEFFAGAKNKLGWGAYATMIQTGTSTSSKKGGDLNQVTYGDPHLTFLHPVFKNADLNINGQLRQYIPLTDYSKLRNTWQTAYYNNISYNLGNKYSLFNQIVPRYFSQDSYAPTDATWVFEGITTVSRQMNSWLSLGVAQGTGWEIHAVTPAATQVDVGPYAHINFTKDIYLEPRLKLPVSKINEIKDGAKDISLNNASAELYFEAKF